MPAQKHVSENFAAGRLSKPMSKLVREFAEKPRLEWEVRNLYAVVLVDCAHTIMLREEGHLSAEQAAALIQELDDIGRAGPEAFSILPGHGSVVLQMERILSERIGEETAGRLPIARSRLDHGATIRRISDRDNLLDVAKALSCFQEMLLRSAAKHGDTAIISYTHMQQAQPATFGHYLLSFHERLQDCFEQLTQVFRRLNRSPLGCVGLSGTDININRHRTASLMGFDDLIENSRLGRDSYYQLDVVSSLSPIMMLLNDICTDLHLWASQEFGTIDMDDAHCSTSSVFPQKKNPYGLEIVKAKSAEAFGWVSTAQAIFRSEGTGDTNVRSVGFLADACRTTANMLLVATEVVGGVTVNTKRCEELLSKAWVTTNRLGNTLLQSHNMSYRSAHGLIARLVKNCIDGDVARADVTLDMVSRAADEMGMEAPADMTQEELTMALDHSEFLKNCVSLGGVGPKEFQRLLVKRTKTHFENTSWLQDTAQNLAEASDRLEAAKATVIKSA